MSDSKYWQACADVHQEIATKLRDYCWYKSSDCIAVDRSYLLAMLDINRMEEVRLLRFQNDVSPWFQHFYQMSVGGRKGHFHSCYLSRFPFPVGAMMGSMETEERQLRLCEAGLRTTIWFPEL